VSEQRRIVAYLDGLYTKVDALKQLQAQTHFTVDMSINKTSTY